MSAEYKGPLAFDLVKLLGRLVDLDPEEKRGLRTDLEGFEGVVAELAQSVPMHGAEAGIPQDVYAHFLVGNETVEFIDESLPAMKKVVEVMEESRAHHVDARQNDISLMVDAMRSRAQRRKDESILTPFEKTIKYLGQTGFKAAKTRKKNEEAKAQAEVEAQAQEQAEASAVEAEVQKQLAAYKTELEAQFKAAVEAAVAQKLAEMTQPAPASQATPVAAS